MMNPLLRTTTTTQIISLPSSSSSTMIKCCSSSSNRGFGYYARTRWVVKEEEEKEEHLFMAGKQMLKALTTPVVASKLVDVLLNNYPALVLSSRTAIFFGAMLAVDLCRGIASARRIGDGGIRFSLGPVLGSVVLSLFALMAVFGKGTIGTVTWEWEGNEKSTITVAHKIIVYMVIIVGYIVLFMLELMVMVFGFGTLDLRWLPSKKSTKLQAVVIEEMVNVVANSVFVSKDTELAGETAARRPEAARAAHEEDPIAKGDNDEEERTRRDKTEHDLLK